MRHVEAKDTVTTAGGPEFTLPGGCILCGGDLDVRVTASGARSICKRCRWISRPHMVRGEDGVQVIHPAGGFA